ncbi:MAG: hypothetical protein CTY31_06215 [Hyphomicrobium sp.]|nr:MAG: hypothetical protein CTY31_06215 [Hyphomicrobium sp.]
MLAAAIPGRRSSATGQQRTTGFPADFIGDGERVRNPQRGQAAFMKFVREILCYRATYDETMSQYALDVSL